MSFVGMEICLRRAPQTALPHSRYAGSVTAVAITVAAVARDRPLREA